MYASGSMNVGGNFTAANLVSNGYVQGTSVYSSGPMSAVGTITGANLTSNGFVVGTSLNTSGAATVSSLVSNTTVSGNSFIMSGNVATTSTTGALTLDIFDKTIYRTAVYVVQVTDNTNSTYHSEQVMLIHDGTNVYQTEYAMMYTSGLLGTFNSSIAGTQLSLTFTATAATNKTIRVVRTTVVV